MAQAMLGPLARGSWVRMTIHVPPSDGPQIESYTCWARSSEGIRRIAEPGSPVRVTLRMLTIGKEHVWLAESLLVVVPGYPSEASHG